MLPESPLVSSECVEFHLFKRHVPHVSATWWMEDDGWVLSPLTVDGGVAWHGFGRRVVVGVRAVQEGLPALTLGERGVKHQPRTRLRIHGTAAWRGTILRIEAEEEEDTGRLHVLVSRCWRAHLQATTVRGAISRKHLTHAQTVTSILL